MQTLIPIVFLYSFSLFIVYPLTKYTTIGNHIWFSSFTYWLSDKFKKESIKDKILNMSYSKLLVCRPCHSFWITLLFSFYITTFKLAIFHSFLTYFLILKYDDKKQR